MQTVASRIAIAFLLLPLAAHADTLPSQEELQKDLNDKNWSELLKGTTRILQLRGPATASYHRTTVWQMKAEALLHSGGGQTSAAASAFTSGAAEKDATADEKDLCLASAMVLKHSTGSTLRLPATADNPTPQQIDIIDPDHRKQAMAALLAAELADANPVIDRLKTILVPTPLITAAKKLGELAPLERVTEKNTDKIDDLEKTLAENFTSSITDWKTKTDARLDELSKLAQQTVTNRYTDNRGISHVEQRPRGLTPQEQTEVRNLISDAKTYADTEQQVAAALTDAGKTEIQKAQAPIQSVYDQAQSVLRAAILTR